MTIEKPCHPPAFAVARSLALALLAGAWLAGCAVTDPQRRAMPGTVPPEPAGRVSVQAGALRSSSGCTITYDVYRRVGAEQSVQIVFAHGFLRDKARSARLARRLADAGYSVATIDLCNMRLWDGAHRRNAADMRRIARALGQRRVLYAGFSAGALAALLAAADDPHSLGVLALDLVDRDGLAVAAAGRLTVPVVGLVGPPSRCNAQNNGLAAFSAVSDVELIRIDGATHCDFEAPTDRLCHLLCEPAGRRSARAEQVRSQIIEAAAGAVERLLGAARAPPAVR